MQFYAYVHLRPDFSPFYVGKGKGNRAYDFKNNRNKYYKNVVAKYGAENIFVEIMNCSCEQEAFLREILIIKSLKELGEELTNITYGGEGVSGLRHSEEAKKKMSLKIKEHNQKNGCHWIGRKHSEETKKKMSFAAKTSIKCIERYKEVGEKLKGRKLSNETKAKVSAALKGKPKPEGFGQHLIGNQHGKGYVPSEESRKKVSERMKGNTFNKGRKASAETKAKLKGKKAWNKGMRASEETRKKQSEAAKNRRNKQ